ncbi:chemotaxis protein CheB [Cupriavidus agavae]|uniref:chemotaxis protein CheB n=1 Tax=Cupriavidus agavae TaxID=1001822 RepID=UPI0013004BB6
MEFSTSCRRGASTGIPVLKALVSELPPDLPASVFIVMHIGRGPVVFQRFFPVSHPVDEETIVVGKVYVAPPDKHMLVGRGQVLLSNASKEHFTRPAADPLFRSAAVNHGKNVVGVVLTGCLEDGAAGLQVIRACGGYTIVQDPATCVAPGMPTAVLRRSPLSTITPVEQLASSIVAAVTCTPRT